MFQELASSVEVPSSGLLTVGTVNMQAKVVLFGLKKDLFDLGRAVGVGRWGVIKYMHLQSNFKEDNQDRARVCVCVCLSVCLSIPRKRFLGNY